MIKITAETKGREVKLSIGIHGTGEEIVDEAVHIMQQLPKHIEEMDKALFLHFLAELVSTDMFDVGMKYGDPEEDAEQGRSE